MNATVLRIYMHENRRYRGRLLYEWLLEQARGRGIHGGCSFRAIAGYGRHGVVHEQSFFELAADLPLVTEFIVSAAEADGLIALLQQSQIDVVYARWSAQFATTLTPNPAPDPAAT